MNFITLGYLAAAVLHLGLASSLIIARRTAWPLNYLLVSSLILMVWGVAMAIIVATDATLSGIIALDALHAFAALLFLGQLIQKNNEGGWRRWFGIFPWLTLPVAGLIFWAARMEEGASLQAPYYFIVAVSVVGLLATEQIYRNSGVLRRRVVALVAVAFATLFVFDLFTYSSAILLGGLNGQLWAARGFINALVVPLLWVAVRRDPDWKSGIFVSRQVVFYSASLVGVGLYLILVAFGGVLIEEFGGSLGGVLQVVFLAASIMLLVLVLFSQQLRRRMKVFLATHFYANRYDYREEWLKLIRRLAQDSERAPMPELCLDALADITDSDGGALWLRDTDAPDNFHLSAKFGNFGDVRDLTFDDELIRFMSETGWVIDGYEASEDPSHYQNQFDTRCDEFVTDDRIFVPIVLDGALTGIAGLSRPAGMPALNFEDHDLLRTVGQQLAVFLQRNRSQELLAEAQQFQVFNRFTAFIMHDLKNLIAQQSLVVANAEKHKSNPAFIDDAMATIANSVKRMNKLLAQLQGDSVPGQRVCISAREILTSVVSAAAARSPAPELVCHDDVEIFADADRLVAVLGHLVRNAQEACDPQTGQVRVSLQRHDTDALIQISDTGTGMDASFIRERLFKPFESTKGAQGMGIGAYQAKDYVEELAGSMRVESTPDQGSRFSIVIPGAGSPDKTRTES